MRFEAPTGRNEKAHGNAMGWDLDDSLSPDGAQSGPTPFMTFLSNEIATRRPPFLGEEGKRRLNFDEELRNRFRPFGAKNC